MLHSQSNQSRAHRCDPGATQSAFKSRPATRPAALHPTETEAILQTVAERHATQLQTALLKHLDKSRASTALPASSAGHPQRTQYWRRQASFFFAEPKDKPTSRIPDIELDFSSMLEEGARPSFDHNNSKGSEPPTTSSGQCSSDSSTAGVPEASSHRSKPIPIHGRAQMQRAVEQEPASWFSDESSDEDE